MILPTHPALTRPAFNWQNPGNGTETFLVFIYLIPTVNLSTDRILATGLKQLISIIYRTHWSFQLTESWQRDWNTSPSKLRTVLSPLSTDRILATGLKPMFLAVESVTTISFNWQNPGNGTETWLLWWLLTGYVIIVLSTDRILATGLKLTKTPTKTPKTTNFQLTESWQRDWNNFL